MLTDLIRHSHFKMKTYFIFWCGVLGFIFNVAAETEANGLKSLVEEQARALKNLEDVVFKQQENDRNLHVVIQKQSLKIEQLLDSDRRQKDDLDKLRSEIEELKREKADDQKEVLAKDKRLLVGYDTENIAFNAQMGSQEPVPKHKTLVFDVTKLNLGNAYNNNTGVFMAPKSGLYIFTFSVHPEPHSWYSIQMVVNNEVKDTIFTDCSEGNEYTVATSVVPAWMNQGDVAYVRTHPTYVSVGKIRSDSIMRSSFGGWKF